MIILLRRISILLDSKRIKAETNTYFGGETLIVTYTPDEGTIKGNIKELNKSL